MEYSLLDADGVLRTTNWRFAAAAENQLSYIPTSHIQLVTIRPRLPREMLQCRLAACCAPQSWHRADADDCCCSGFGSRYAREPPVGLGAASARPALLDFPGVECAALEGH